MYKKTERMVAKCLNTNQWLGLEVGKEYNVIGFQDDREIDGKFYYRLDDGTLYWDKHFTTTYMLPVFTEYEPSKCLCCGNYIYE